MMTCSYDCSYVQDFMLEVHFIFPVTIYRSKGDCDMSILPEYIAGNEWLPAMSAGNVFW